MKLITWNSAGRMGAIPKQLEFLRGRSPDLVALQEVTPNSAKLLIPGLRELGLEHELDTIERTGRGPRRYGVLLASRYPLHAAGRRIESPWPEKALSVEVDLRTHALEVHTVHVPPGASNGWRKIEVLESVFAALATPSELPRILCGDFNTPQEELENGDIITWAQRISASGGVRMMRTKRGQPAERWDAGERNVLAGLAEYGLRDAFRATHGYETAAWSWSFSRRKREIRRRFDHVFASEKLKVLSCQYLPAAREKRLSDHVPLELEFMF